MAMLTILRIQDKSFAINQDNFISVLQKVKDHPVILISMNGCMREGKSYALSHFIMYLRNNCQPGWYKPGLHEKDCFSWRSGTKRETVGINIWSEPFLIDHQGKKVAVLLLDCQGLFDNQTTYGQNAAIYGLSALLSSVLVYNVMKKIEEDLLQKISYFSDYAQAIAPKTPDTEDLPNFLFLIRDFENEDEYGLGFHNRYNFPRPQGLEEPSNYWQHIFHPTPGEGGKLIPECNLAVRDSIQRHYNNTGAFLMPHPGRNFVRESMKRAPEADFQEHMQSFVETAINWAVTKKIGKEEVTGAKLIENVRVWAELCENSKDKFPEAFTIGETTAIMQNDIAANTALETCKRQWKLFLEKHKGGAPDGALASQLPTMTKDAVTTYLNNRSLGSTELVEKYKKKVEDSCHVFFQEVIIPLNEGNRKVEEERLKAVKEMEAREAAEKSLSDGKFREQMLDLAFRTFQVGVDGFLTYQKGKRADDLVKGLSAAAFDRN